MDRKESLLRIIREAAVRLESLSGGRHDITSKAENDFVTACDREIEEFIRNEIHSEFPQDGILGEEYGSEVSHDSYLWIVDPIDGTVNFMNTYPQYTISIALKKGEDIIAGAVFNPPFGELFHAFRSEGAFLNGKRIKADDDLPLNRTLALVVPPHRRHEYLEDFWTQERKIYDLVSDTRSIGSAALSLCYTACGRCSMYYEWFLHIYDIAAGLLIAQEAGCAHEIRKEGDVYRLLSYSRHYENEIKGKILL